MTTQTTKTTPKRAEDLGWVHTHDGKTAAGKWLPVCYHEGEKCHVTRSAWTALRSGRTPDVSAADWTALRPAKGTAVGAVAVEGPVPVVDDLTTTAVYPYSGGMTTHPLTFPEPATRTVRDIAAMLYACGEESRRKRTTNGNIAASFFHDAATYVLDEDSVEDLKRWCAFRATPAWVKTSPGQSRRVKSKTAALILAML